MLGCLINIIYCFETCPAIVKDDIWDPSHDVNHTIKNPSQWKSRIVTFVIEGAILVELYNKCILLI